MNTIHFLSFVAYIFIHSLSCIWILWIHLLLHPFCPFYLSWVFHVYASKYTFWMIFQVNLFLALPKPKTWVELLLLFFSPWHRVNIHWVSLERKGVEAFQILEMPTLCRGKTLWAIIVCPPIILQKYAQVYVEYVNFSWAYVILFKWVDRILVNKNLIKIGTNFLCSYDNFLASWQKEFDFCCKLSNFLLHLKGGRGGGFIAHTESLSTMCK